MRIRLQSISYATQWCDYVMYSFPCDAKKNLHTDTLGLNTFPSWNFRVWPGFVRDYVLKGVSWGCCLADLIVNRFDIILEQLGGRVAAIDVARLACRGQARYVPVTWTIQVWNGMTKVSIELTRVCLGTKEWDLGVCDMNELVEERVEVGGRLVDWADHNPALRSKGA